MSAAGDGPLHDHAGEAAQARDEAVAALVETWKQEPVQIEWALRIIAGTPSALSRLAGMYELSDELLGKNFRELIDCALLVGAVRELDA